MRTCKIGRSHGGSQSGTTKYLLASFMVPGFRLLCLICIVCVRIVKYLSVYGMSVIHMPSTHREYYPLYVCRFVHLVENRE